MPAFRIFYSWQGVTPSRENRSFIEEALRRAAKLVRDDETMNVEPIVDRDTQGLPGAPDIKSAIFDKIDSCDMFVADVSFINAGSRFRLTPNPNVLIELGYAIKARGWSRVNFVFNSAFGRTEDLPFDLRSHRATVYELAVGAEKPEARRTLTSIFEAAIKATIALNEQHTVSDVTRLKLIGLKETLKRQRISLQTIWDEANRSNTGRVVTYTRANYPIELSLSDSDISGYAAIDEPLKQAIQWSREWNRTAGSRAPRPLEIAKISAFLGCCIVQALKQCQLILGETDVPESIIFGHETYQSMSTPPWQR